MSNNSAVLHGSLWSRELERRYPALSEDREVDVVVVGAGLAGLVTATLLQDAGCDVLVIERDVIGGIATRNTTAKVTALQGTTLSKIAATRDADAALAYASAQVDAVIGLRRLIESKGIDCALTTADAITFAAHDDGAERVTDELDAALRAGLAVESTNEIGFPIEVKAAVRLRDQFHMNPGLLCRGLADNLGDDAIVEYTSVQDVDEHDRVVTVTTENARVRAGHAVLATQSPIIDPMLLANRCVPAQSYALAVTIDRDIPDTMCLSADDFTISLRPAMADDQPVLIVGGNGHAVGDFASPMRWNELEVWAEKLGQIEVLHRWATHDLVTSDYVPFIGRLRPSSECRYVATGFGKWGMTNSYVAAQLITDAVTGAEAKPWAPTFDSTRVRATLTRNIAKAGSAAAHHLVADRLTGRPEPRCTHQGCVLRHDDALDTWDCPCHGSRFDRAGNVLQGPANSPLKSDS
jgi:glycine/D-amino acid oxidase-like deaminating enzyme